MARPVLHDLRSRAWQPLPLCLLALTLSCGSDGTDEPDEPAAMMTVAPAIASTPAPSEARPAASSATPAAPAPAPSATPARPAAESPSAAGSADLAAMPVAQAVVFAACTYSEGSYGRNCDSLFVTMKQTSPARCAQLTIDNCGEDDRPAQGQTVRVPTPWGFDSGTVSSDPESCELGVFDTSSTVAQRATGTITWNETTRLPTELVLDVTLETSNIGAPNTLIELTTTASITPSVCTR